MYAPLLDVEGRELCEGLTLAVDFVRLGDGRSNTCVPSSLTGQSAIQPVSADRYTARTQGQHLQPSAGAAAMLNTLIRNARIVDGTGFTGETPGTLLRSGRNTRRRSPCGNEGGGTRFSLGTVRRVRIAFLHERTGALGPVGVLPVRDQRGVGVVVRVGEPVLEALPDHAR